MYLSSSRVEVPRQSGAKDTQITLSPSPFTLRYGPVVGHRTLGPLPDNQKVNEGSEGNVDFTGADLETQQIPLNREAKSHRELRDRDLDKMDVQDSIDYAKKLRASPRHAT
ncbi:hypothetical protein NMY22_g12859 [Coprinellus aureogranulatus]|nr:hypothetical protein NMY22_g12859 [Coprinellus aureogranulatus]